MCAGISGGSRGGTVRTLCQLRRMQIAAAALQAAQMTADQMDAGFP